MNIDNLRTLIKRYEDNLELIYNKEHNELFKWKAIQIFKNIWNDPENVGLNFAKRFNKAKKESSVLLDNSRMCPSTGVVKLAEVAEEEVERLFFNVLLAEDGGDIVKRHNNMEAFLSGMEDLRVKYYPQCWKYKQDRHSASCYLCFFAPDTNYIYHYTEVEKFARHIEFGLDIGQGESFRLENYYKMCEEVIPYLRENTSLMSKHQNFISDDEYYNDESLHILVFNLIWCANTYNFYKGMTHISKKESIKEYTLAQLREKEKAELEEKRNAILDEINQLETEVAAYGDINLIGVQVYKNDTGEIGTIVEQKVNKITVQYEAEVKKYVINKKFVSRPRFEDDEEIVEAFTEYDDKTKELELLRKELERLNKT